MYVSSSPKRMRPGWPSSSSGSMVTVSSASAESCSLVSESALEPGLLPGLPLALASASSRTGAFARMADECSDLPMKRSKLSLRIVWFLASMAARRLSSSALRRDTSASARSLSSRARSFSRTASARDDLASRSLASASPTLASASSRDERRSSINSSFERFWSSFLFTSKLYQKSPMKSRFF